MIQNNCSTQDFDYTLPPALIANFPLDQRTDSRLLVLDKESGDINHGQFLDILELVKPGDLIVFNQSKVIPARLFAHKPSGGKVEILIERVLSDNRALVHLKASKTPKINTTIVFDHSSTAQVLARVGDLFELGFDENVYGLMERVGHMPLPPYIKRSDELSDKTRYQTVYAKDDGSVAAPTAGLHFDNDLLAKLKAKGVNAAFVILHVGAGTFQPVRVDNVKDHQMHSEWIEVPEAVCQQVRATKKNGSRVIAVGTTSVRALESAALNGKLEPYQGETDIFIYPGFQFKVIDAMITNFHLPQSTLLMLVSAFCGKANIERAYQQAISQHYRFFSYGDAMLLI